MDGGADFGKPKSVEHGTSEKECVDTNKKAEQEERAAYELGHCCEPSKVDGPAALVGGFGPEGNWGFAGFVREWVGSFF